MRATSRQNPQLPARWTWTAPHFWNCARAPHNRVNSCQSCCSIISSIPKPGTVPRALCRSTCSSISSIPRLWTVSRTLSRSSATCSSISSIPRLRTVSRVLCRPTSSYWPQRQMFLWHCLSAAGWPRTKPSTSSCKRRLKAREPQHCSRPSMA